MEILLQKRTIGKWEKKEKEKALVQQIHLGEQNMSFIPLVQSIRKPERENRR